MPAEFDVGKEQCDLVLSKDNRQSLLIAAGGDVPELPLLTEHVGVEHR